jgi:hypothetical protein
MPTWVGLPPTLWLVTASGARSLLLLREGTGGNQDPDGAQRDRQRGEREALAWEKGRRRMCGLLRDRPTKPSTTTRDQGRTVDQLPQNLDGCWDLLAV